MGLTGINGGEESPPGRGDESEWMVPSCFTDVALQHNT